MINNIVATLGHGDILGANTDVEQTNFAIYSSTATKIELCLYDEQGDAEVARFALHQGEQYIWHVRLSNINSKQIYSYFIHGDYIPEQGIWHDASQPLLDPYAREIHGTFSWSIGEHHHNDDYCLKPTPPKAKVSAINKYRGNRPNTPWHRTFIYECHVKGVSQYFPKINNNLRGKFLALASTEFIQHVKGLGITAIELLPSQYFISEEFLVDKGLSNYWGYNTLNFFTPHPDYLVNDDIREFQRMVSAFHHAGIEVIIDVVYNHTAEGSNLGPTLSFRGIDNTSYYRVHKEKPSEYINDTGCGNTLNISSPATLRLVMDSLRYWVEYMGVDGFRFDLATILGRKYAGFRANMAFFQTIAQDPILSKVKLIAEPWDIGPGGYHLGNFSAPWREWNDQYRDTVRQFWRGDPHQLPLFAKYFHGSVHLFEAKSRPVTSGINFITAHDGFTLNDLVTFENKHNIDNGENNRDGHNKNYSHNWGHEGATTDVSINSQRITMQKNMLLTLILSQGVPMISAGCEVAHSQQGNNNAYCQDNDINWINWQKEQDIPAQHPLYQFIQQVFALRHEMSFYQQNHFIHDNDPRFALQWLNSQAKPMTNSDWQQPDNHHLAYLIHDKHTKKTLLILFNASTSNLLFSLPAIQKLWQQRIDTSSENQTSVIFPSDCKIIVKAHSSWVLSSTEQEIDFEE